MIDIRLQTRQKNYYFPQFFYLKHAFDENV